MKINSVNEYSNLKSVLVGSVDNFHWPTGDQAFDKSLQESTYPGSISRGPLDKTVQQQTKDDLDRLIEILDKNGIQTFRPKVDRPHWAYSARDILLTVGNKIIECPTPFASRWQEGQQYDYIKNSIIESGCSWITAPRNSDIMFDAANVCKFNDKLLYLISSTGNRQGAEWLQKQIGTDFEVILWEGVYAFAHIDSTISSLNHNTIMINGSRVKEDTLPKFLKEHKKIWVHDVVARNFHEFPYASKWIGLNVLSIDPDTVIVDSIQKGLIKNLEDEKFKVLHTELRHSRTLGGGFHCVTCDLEREF